LNIYEAFELGNPWSYFFVVKIVLDWDAWVGQLISYKYCNNVAAK